MHYYKAIIRYDGTGYAGFQYQKDAPTVQNEFNQAIKTIIEGKVTTMGASRTDTGVHAMEQVVKITSLLPVPFEESSLLVNLNKILPSQIRCLDIIPCNGDFKPASDSQSKEYRYYFTNKKSALIEERRFIANFSHPLNLNLMNNCTQQLIGTHNFGHFCSSGSNVKSTIRTINICHLSEINPHTIFNHSQLFSIPKDLTTCYQLIIEGNGFLKQMVRHIVSAIWMVGSQKLTLGDFSNLLKTVPLKNDKRLWKVASPNGLFLYKIISPNSEAT